MTGLLIAAIAAGTAAVYEPVQTGVSRRMEHLKSRLLEGLEDAVGRRISYGSVSPSILRELEIRDLRVHGPDGSTLVEIPLLKIHYRLAALLLGRPAEAVDEIVLENAVAGLDLDRDRDLLSHLGNASGTGADTDGGTGPAPGDGTALSGVRIVGRNLSLHVRAGADEFEARRLFFQLQPGREGYDLRLKSLLTYNSRDPGALLRKGGTVVDLKGLLAPNLRRGEGTLGFSRLETNLFDLERQTFQISLGDDGVAVRKIQDRAPLDLTVFYDFSSGSLRGEALSEKLRPSSLLTMKEKGAVLNQWLGAETTIRGNAVFNVRESSLAFAADFDVLLSGPATVRRTRLAGKASGNESGVAFSPVVVTNPRGRAVFSGDLRFRDLLPRGELVLSEVSLGGAGFLRGRFRLDRGRDLLTARAEELALGGAVFHDFRGALRIFPDGLDIEARLSFDAAAPGVPGPEVSGETRETQETPGVPGEADASSAAGTPGASVFLDLPSRPGKDSRFSLDLRALPLTTLFSVLRSLGVKAPDLDSPFVMDSALRGTAGPGGLTLDLPVFALRDPGADEAVLAASGSYAGGAVELREWRVRWKGYQGSGSVSGDFSPDGRFLFSARSRVMDRSYHLQGVLDPQGSLTLEEPQGLTARFFHRDGVYGNLSLDRFPVPLARSLMTVSGRLDARYRGAGSWSADLRNFEAAGFSPLPHLKGSLRLSAALAPGQGVIRDLWYGDQYSSLQGGGNLRYSWDPPRLDADVSLTGADGKERSDLMLRWEEEGLAGVLTLRAFPLERLAAEAAAGSLDGSLSFSGFPGKLRMGLSARLDQGRAGDQPLSFRFSAGLGDGIAELKGLEASYGEMRLGEGTVRYDLGTGALRFSGVGGPPKTEWRLEGDFNARPADGATLRDRLAGAELVGEFFVSTSSEKVRPPFRYWGFTLMKREKRIRVQGGPENSVEGEMHEDGSFWLKVRDPLPVTFDAEGNYRDGELEANVNRISFMAESFGDALDLTIIRFTRGRATGNLRITGSLRDPDFFGAMTVSQGYARLELIPEDLGPYRGNVIFREKEFTIQPMTVPVGKGSAEVSGVFQFNRWIPEIFSLTVDTKLSEGVHIAYNFGGVIVDGMGQGRVLIEGDGRKVTVSGNVHASNAVITIGDLKAAEAQRQASEPEPIRVDLTFQTGKSVEFSWPSPEFPILQAYANRGEKLGLMVDGDTGDFRLVGDIGIRGGEIYYFERRFFIREGSIRFNERADSFDPILNARAEIRETTGDGPVRIYLVADNTRLSQFSPRFESDSALTGNEIMAILGRGVFGTEKDGPINLSTALLFTSDILTQIGVVKTFEKQMRDRLGLDLFSVRTHLVQNLLENVVSRENEGPRDVDTPSFGRYLDKTSVFLGKYIGADLFLELLLQLRAADPLARDTRDFGGLDIDTELILEWNTPLFLLEWSLLPRNPGELFIRDNKITFRWKFSY